MARALELTFKKYAGTRQGGRWCKKIHGKLHYFGTGRNRSDRTSYRKALKQYRQFMEKMAATAHIQEIARTLYRSKLAEAGIPVDDAAEPLTPRAIAEGALDHVDLGEPADDSGDPADRGKSLDDLLAMISSRRRLARSSRPRPADARTIDQYVRQWLQAEQRRYQAKEITLSACKSKQQGIKTFQSFVGPATVFDESRFESLLTDYRQHLQQMRAAGLLSPNTFNDKVKFLRQFVQWAYKQRIFKEMPRNLDDIVRRVPVTRAGEPLSLEDIQKLWSHADGRMRCWIALGLNCGFKNKDISELTADHLKNGRIIGYRHKARRGAQGVPMNYKLWPVTRQLIEAHRQDRDQDTGGRLFINAKGNALVTETGSDLIGKQFKRLAKQAGVTATFQQLRDTAAQAVKDGAMRGGRYDAAVVQLFLAHVDSSTASYYVANDPEQMVTDSLDRAIDQLNSYFNLVADAPRAENSGRPKNRQAMVRCLVKRDEQGNIVEVRARRKGRPPSGFRLESIPQEQANQMRN